MVLNKYQYNIILAIWFIPTAPLPPLEGCYTTVITWEKNRCAVQKQMVRLVNDDATGFISAYVQVVGCCNTDGCQVAGRKERKKLKVYILLVC